MRRQALVLGVKIISCEWSCLARNASRLCRPSIDHAWCLASGIGLPPKRMSARLNACHDDYFLYCHNASSPIAWHGICWVLMMPLFGHQDWRRFDDVLRWASGISCHVWTAIMWETYLLHILQLSWCARCLTQCGTTRSLTTSIEPGVHNLFPSGNDFSIISALKW